MNNSCTLSISRCKVNLRRLPAPQGGPDLQDLHKEHPWPVAPGTDGHRMSSALKSNVFDMQLQRQIWVRQKFEESNVSKSVLTMIGNCMLNQSQWIYKCPEYSELRIFRTIPNLHWIVPPIKGWCTWISVLTPDIAVTSVKKQAANKCSDIVNISLSHIILMLWWWPNVINQQGFAFPSPSGPTDHWSLKPWRVKPSSSKSFMAFSTLEIPSSRTCNT